MEKGNELGQGRVVFKDIGGAEVYPTFEQMKAVQAGSIDLLDSAAIYGQGVFYESSVPETFLFGQTATDWKESGMIELLDRIGRKKYGIGVLTVDTMWDFYIFTKKPVKSLKDLRGVKIRSTPLYAGVLKHWEIPFITTPLAEIYTALKTGVVDGFTWPVWGSTGTALQEQVGYQVFPPLWTAAGAIVTVNAKWYDGLPDYAKQVISDVMEYRREQLREVSMQGAAHETKILRKADVQAITIPEDEWWQSQKAQWEWMSKKLRENSPDHADELLEILSKMYPPKKVLWPTYDWQKGAESTSKWLNYPK
jgi:TRAP-type C4-dicarboxylate transport system substrate-binding protein